MGMPAVCCQSAGFCNERSVFCYRPPCHFRPFPHSLDHKSPPLHQRQFRSLQDHVRDCSASAEYIVPPNSEGRTPSFTTRSTPASVKSWRSLSKPTGYGPHLFGFDRSYSTIKKRSVTDKSLLSGLLALLSRRRTSSDQAKSAIRAGTTATVPGSPS